jgi:hypothetical protein
MHTSIKLTSPTAPKGTTLNTTRCRNCTSRVSRSTTATTTPRITGSPCVTNHLDSYVTEKLSKVGEGGGGIETKTRMEGREVHASQ